MALLPGPHQPRVEVVKRFAHYAGATAWLQTDVVWWWRDHGASLFVHDRRRPAVRHMIWLEAADYLRY